MYNKTLIWLGVGVGSTVGSVVPALWGANFLSLNGPGAYESLLGTLVGGIIGIWAAIKLSTYF
jgi:gas vesicle protein